MRHRTHSRLAREWVAYYAALATAAIVLLGSLLAAIVWVSRAAAAEPLELSAEGIVALLQRDAAQSLGVNVAVETLRPLALPQLPPGRLELTVRYPARAGFFLPSAVECRVDGVLRSSIPLGQYVQFRLPVLVARDSLGMREALSASSLETKVQALPPGSEVTTALDQVLGRLTRGSIAAGTRIVLSRLMRPFDVSRGSVVLLVLKMDGVRMEARSVALADAYIGQRVMVERCDDKCKYTGLLCDGPLVVVQ